MFICLWGKHTQCIILIYKELFKIKATILTQCQIQISLTLFAQIKFKYQSTELEKVLIKFVSSKICF